MSQQTLTYRSRHTEFTVVFPTRRVSSPSDPFPGSAYHRSTTLAAARRRNTTMMSSLTRRVCVCRTAAGAVRPRRVRLLRRADRVRAGGPAPERAVARVHQPADVSGRGGGGGGRRRVRHRPPTGDGQHARLPVRAGVRAPVHGPPGAGQLHGVARRGVVRGVRGPEAARPAADAARGAVRPAGPRAALGRVRGRRVVRPVPGRGRHVRVATFRRAGQGRGHGHGGEHTPGDVRHVAQLRYARTPRPAQRRILSGGGGVGGN